MYLWKFVPGVADDISIPNETVKKQFYNGLLDDCNDKMIEDLFKHGLGKYNYPWMSSPDSEAGKFWATTLARAARVIAFYTKPSSDFNDATSWESVRDKVHTKVFGERTEWEKYLKDLFEEARQLTLKYKAAQEEAQASGPRELMEAEERRRATSF